MTKYAILTVPDNASNTLESVGSKQKFWYYRDDIEDSRPWLFKANRPGTGEDWAERIASELCALLGLPHVGYELAQWGDTPGVVCRRLDRDDETLTLGNVVLSRRYAEYPRLTAETFARVRAHTLATVFETLESQDLSVQIPPGWTPPPGIEAAADVFVGYLMLDAWLGNTDRHDKNWAIVERAGPGGLLRYLASTFDHASSLGREITDTERHKRLESRDRGYQVEAYVRRARSALFNASTDRHPMRPAVAFGRASQLRPQAGDAWRARLQSVPADAVKEAVARIPDSRMTNLARTFALRVLTLNREALCASAPNP